MIIEDLEYRADSARLVGQLAFETGTDNKRPGILVVPEGGGLGPHAKSRAQRLACLGYVALAVDLYGDGAPARDMSAGLEWVRTLTKDTGRLRERMTAACGALASHPRTDSGRIAAIGFCFGGTAALELARSGADVKGVVGFHCVLSTTAQSGATDIKGKVLVCLGADDPIVPSEQRTAFEAEMKAAGRDWQMNVYGGAKHSFTNPDAGAAGWPALAYSRNADERSWEAMQAFLRELFRDAGP